MGQKVNPTGLRLGINRTWDSRWYAGKKEYGKLLQEDIKIRDYLSDKLKAAGVSRIVIERPHKKCRVTIHSARPGVVIGKKGADIEKLKSDVQKYTADEVHLNIVEIRKPEIDAKLVAENIAQQLERRVAFRRVMKRFGPDRHAVGALGIRITCAGRLAARNRAVNGTQGRESCCTPCARHQITASPPLSPPMAPAASGLIQRRDHGARSLRHREAPGQRGRSRKPSAARA
jgi:ribosomal protein S3